MLSAIKDVADEIKNIVF